VVLEAPTPQKGTLDDITTPPNYGVIASEPPIFRVLKVDVGGGAAKGGAGDEDRLVPEKSVFAPRKAHSDAHSFYSSERLTLRAFVIDWSRCNNERFRYLISDTDDGGNAGVDIEVGEVRDTLAAHHRAIYAAHSYYCAVDEKAPHRYAMGKREFFDFLRQIDVIDEASKFADVPAFEAVFSAANFEQAAKPGDHRQKELNSTNDDDALMRFEFLQALPRIAIAKYVRPKILGDVSEALEQLITVDMLPRLPPEAKHDSDLFRTRRLYKRDVNSYFTAMAPVLRTVFDFYSMIEPDPMQLDLKTPVPTMSMEEWLSFLMDADLLCVDDSAPTDGLPRSPPKVTPLEARLCMAWSQTFVSDELRRRSKLTSATYEDFLEALCRLCTRMVLPTDDLLRKYNARTCKAFFDDVAEGKHRGDVMLRESALAMTWQKEEATDEPLAPTLQMLVGLILDRLDGDSNGKLTKAELQERRKEGAKKREALLHSRSQMPKSYKPKGARKGAASQTSSSSQVSTPRAKAPAAAPAKAAKAPARR